MVNYTTYYMDQDALGSTRLVMPASMVSSFSSNYIPYGTSYAMTGKELFQYTGKVLDESTGLYYEGARYYDPTTGRFTTEDSYSGTETDPITRNRYVYGADDPMRHVDPTGHMSVASSTFGGVITMVEVVPTSTTITQVVKVVPQSPAAQNPNSPSAVFNQASMQQQMTSQECQGHPSTGEWRGADHYHQASRR